MNTTGIIIRHSRTCAAQADRLARCTCSPSYRAEVYDRRSGAKIRKTFGNISEARGWRSDVVSSLRKGTMRAPTKTTLREAWKEWLEGAKAGTIRNRRQEPYKASTLRAYSQSITDHVLPELGSRRLHDIEQRDLQDLADRLLADGKDPSTIRNAINPVRVIFRRAIRDKQLVINHASGLELPAAAGRRDRIASPEEGAELIESLAERDRALWATAMYAGLRRGELMALRIEDVDLAGGTIRVERSYDPKGRVFTTPKSRAGTRRVPIAAGLRSYLVSHKLRLGWGEGLLFGATPERPFTDSNVRRRAETAWKAENKTRAAEGRPLLVPIGLHECRHTFASLMIAAGVNSKALSTYMGHSSVTITLDRYGHLMPGNEEESASLLDAYLERTDTRARLAQLQG